MMRRALNAGDPYDEVDYCWTAKEKVRLVCKPRTPTTPPFPNVGNRASSSRWLGIGYFARSPR